MSVERHLGRVELVEAGTGQGERQASADRAVRGCDGSDYRAVREAHRTGVAAATVTRVTVQREPGAAYRDGDGHAAQRRLGRGAADVRVVRLHHRARRAAQAHLWRASTAGQPATDDREQAAHVAHGGRDAQQQRRGDVREGVLGGGVQREADPLDEER